MSPRKSIWLALAVALAVTAVSCSVYEAKYAKGPPPMPVPKSFSGSGTGQRVDRWWVTFGDDGLTAIVGRALSGNLDLMRAWARLDQARAVAKIAGADLAPHLQADGLASRTRREVEGGLLPDRVVRTDLFRMDLAASYEVDLWRRIHSERDAAVADVRASRADLDAAAISVAASVGEVWFALAEQMAQDKLLNDQLDVSKTYLDLTEARFGQGQASALDVYQQRTQYAAVQSQVPRVQGQLEVLRHQLAVLVGELPRAKVESPKPVLPELPGLPSTGLPAELIVRRPDVQAAYARLAAADQRVATAVAALLPSLRLSAVAGVQGTEANELFQRGLWSIAGNLTAPLFEGGRRRAEVERTKAVVEERLREYEQAVLVAFREVEDALVQESRQAEFITKLDQQVDLARSTLKQAQDRYVNGLNDYLPVLTALQPLQQLERDRLSAQRDLISFRIALYRALGGSWPEDMARPARPSPAQQGGGAGS